MLGCFSDGVDKENPVALSPKMEWSRGFSPSQQHFHKGSTNETLNKKGHISVPVCPYILVGLGGMYRIEYPGFSIEYICS